jgi:DNA helicase HerA-like ATPase
LVGNMEEEYVGNIGRRPIWGGDKFFGITAADRRHHVYIIGKTGTGKTTLLRNLLVQDIEAGHGVGLIDPHGDLANEILDYIPPSRIDDVVYFNPADLDFPIGFNLLQNVPAEGRHRVASGIVGTFRAIWPDSWGPRTEYILYAAVAALLECQNVSVLGITRMLSDDHYRRWVLKQVKEPMVRSFWINEFDNYEKRFRQEAIAPIQNKLGQLLMSAPVRNILGQVKRKIDSRFMMDDRRIFIANLSKGLLGEDKANLLGSVLLTSFQLAAMERANIPESERRDFFLHIDEFQNFTTDTFTSVLSEARKYKLGMVLSNQYTAQIREPIKDAVFGNVGTLISFRVGGADGKELAQEFGSGYAPEHFTGLHNHEVLVRPLVAGEQVAPFTGKTLPPQSHFYGQREKILRRSREKYATPRKIVEDKIRRWLER